MIIDTHAHYDDLRFQEDRREVIGALRKQGIEAVINAGATLQGCEDSVALTEEYEFFYCGVGIHPDEVGKLDEKVFSRLRMLAKKEKVVAIGEIGLDYHWNVEPKEVQQKWFIRQMQLAKEEGLPILIHSREAVKDTLSLVQKHGRELTGIVHAYSGSVETAKEYVKMGYFLGIGGVVTFRNAEKLKEVVREIPLTSLVLETDCPYLTPHPHRGKRNSSLYLPYVVKEIAKIKGISTELVEKQTTDNAKSLFGI